MLGVVIVGVAVTTVLAGLAIKLYTDHKKSAHEITLKEFILGTFAIVCIVAPLAGWGSYKAALASRATFRQFLNGYETTASVQTTTCSRDGPCAQEYNCDPYIVMVSYECGTTKSPQTCYRPETRYHRCPYVTHEYTYTVATTLGNYTFGAHRFPENPDQHRWRASEAVPDYVSTRAGVGPPRDWLRVRARLDSGRPGPVTKLEHYDNYVLASERTLLKQWSAEAQRLDSLKLLPSITRTVVGYYDADKLTPIAWHGAEWNKRLAYLNSAVGPRLHGDIRLVVVRAPVALSADAYTFALLAHWQNAEKFGTEALPKNTLVFVLGTLDGQRVAWARAGTGMPMGNEALIAATRTAFTGRPLHVDTIIGQTRVVHVNGQLQIQHGDGIMESLVFGLRDPQTKFARVSMKAEQLTDVGTGFLYLKGEIRPSTAGWVGITLATFLFCLGVWAVLLFFVGYRQPTYGRRTLYNRIR